MHIINRDKNRKIVEDGPIATNAKRTPGTTSGARCIRYLITIEPIEEFHLSGLCCTLDFFLIGGKIRYVRDIVYSKSA